jgi:hypothetical protein
MHREANPSTVCIRTALYDRQMTESLGKYSDAKDENGDPLHSEDADPECRFGQVLLRTVVSKSTT